MNRKTNESSLDRISETLNNYETVFITTYRKTKTVEDNIKSNIELKQDLIKSGYGVSKVKEIYQENKQDKQLKEKFFVVVNLKNEPNFYEKMKGCGIKYEQDSIIYSNPSIGKSVLVSLNGGADDNFNGIKTRIIKDGDNSDQCITIVGNREFVFKSGHMHIWENKNIYSKRYLDKILLQEEENYYNMVKYSVNESSLNKIVQALNNYESVFITTYRGDKTVKQNIDNNVNLKIKLLKLGYGVIMIDGRCQENVSDQVPKEKFFVVTNLINNPNFLESMKAFCNEYEQDAVLYSNPKDNKTVLVDLKKVGKDEVFDKITTIIEDSPDEKGNLKEKAISIIANRKFVFENTYMREYASMTIYSKCFLEKRLINEEQK